MSELIKVTIEVPEPPSGWKYDGFRKVCYKERFFRNGQWEVWSSSFASDLKYPVAVCDQRWRPATRADVGRTDARFSLGKQAWAIGTLIYVSELHATPFVSMANASAGAVLNVGAWTYCEVPVLEDER